MSMDRSLLQARDKSQSMNFEYREVGAARENALEAVIKEIEGGEGEKQLSPNARAFQETFQALLRESHSRLSEVFAEYEDRLLDLLGEVETASALLGEVQTSTKGATATERPVDDSYGRQREAPAREAGSMIAHAPSAQSASAHAAQAAEGDLQEGAASDMENLCTKERSNVLLIDAHQLAVDAVENLDENIYRVEDFYHKTGWIQSVARSDWFNDVTLFVIMLNAVYLGYDANSNTEDLLVDATWGYILCENLFCAFFVLEIVLRFLAFEKKCNCLRDHWFKFDGSLVVLMIFEVWAMLALTAAGVQLQALPTAPLRLLRLARLSRLVRLLRSLPEMVTMIKGVRTASRAVFCTIIMVLLLVYIFSIVILMACESLTHGDDELSVTINERFGSLQDCMWCLLLDGTFLLDAYTVLNMLKNTGMFEGYVAILIFMVFVLLSSLTLLNMLIGVLCEVVTAVGEQEREEADIRLVKRGILEELLKFDVDGDGVVTRAELERVMKSKRTRHVLEELDVDTASLDEIIALLFTDESRVTIKKVLETCLSYRGSQPPTVRHVVDSMWFSRFFLEKTVRECTEELTRTFVRQNSMLTRSMTNLSMTNLSGTRGWHFEDYDMPLEDRLAVMDGPVVTVGEVRGSRYVPCAKVLGGTRTAAEGPVAVLAELLMHQRRLQRTCQALSTFFDETLAMAQTPDRPVMCAKLEQTPPGDLDTPEPISRDGTCGSDTSPMNPQQLIQVKGELLTACAEMQRCIGQMSENIESQEPVHFRVSSRANIPDTPV